MIVGLVLVGAVLGGVGTLLAGPTYTSESAVLYSPGAVTYLDETVDTDPNLADREVTDQVDVVYSDDVMGSAAKTLGVEVDALREDTSVQTATGSSLLTISGSAADASTASQQVAAVADAYVTYLQDNGRGVLDQRAEILQGTVDRQTAQLDTLNTQLSELNDQLGGLASTSPRYAVVQGRLERVATQITELTTRNADIVDQQETLRASSELFPGEAFVLQQAQPPRSPSSLSVPAAIAVGAALGLVVGACLVAFTDTRRRPASAVRGSAQTTV